MNSIQIFTDGGSRGNPGPAASAFYVFHNAKVVHKDSKYLGVTTNNVAEYEAVLLALGWLKENFRKMEISKTEFVLDSELVVKQINGLYKVKDVNMRFRHEKVKNIISEIPCEFIFKSVPRDRNKDADGLVNETLDKAKI